MCRQVYYIQFNTAPEILIEFQLFLKLCGFIAHPPVQFSMDLGVKDHWY